jgi:microcystin degradation protein MlrC
VEIGRTALLKIGPIIAVVSERKPFMLDASVFHHVGLDPRDFRVVQVKSGGGFRAAFESLAVRIIDLETSGPSSSNFSRLPYRRIRRPLWPLDRAAALFESTPIRHRA